MASLAFVGSAIMGAIGVTGVSAGISTVVGGIVIGAAIGGIYSAVTGGSILEGMLYGAVGGAVIGAGSALAIGGTSAFGSGVTTVATEGSAALSTAAAEGAKVFATESFMVGEGAMGGAISQSASSGGILGTIGQSGGLGALATIGSSVLEGSQQGKTSEEELAYKYAELAQSKELAYAEFENALARAEIAAAAGGTDNTVGLANIEENRRQFDKEFEEAQYQDRRDFQTAEDMKKDHIAGINSAAASVAGSTSVSSVVETNAKRLELPKPTWASSQTTTSTQQGVTA